MSDDGSRIGFLRLLINLDNLFAPELQTTEPFIMNANGSGLRQLFEAPSPKVSCLPPALSGDGSRAAFTCTDGASREGRLYINNAQGEDLKPVTSPLLGLELALPSISDSNLKIAFAAGADLAGQNHDGNAEIFIATDAVEALAAPENP
jgi:Tol biopolymer transport system component